MLITHLPFGVKHNASLYPLSVKISTALTGDHTEGPFFFFLKKKTHSNHQLGFHSSCSWDRASCIDREPRDTNTFVAVTAYCKFIWQTAVLSQPSIGFLYRRLQAVAVVGTPSSKQAWKQRYWTYLDAYQLLLTAGSLAWTLPAVQSVCSCRSLLEEQYVISVRRILPSAPFASEDEAALPYLLISSPNFGTCGSAAPSTRW